jgi:hypothetical protein
LDIYIDYSELNKSAIKNELSIPCIDEFPVGLYGLPIFTKIDLRSGYHQIRLAKCDQLKQPLKLIMIIASFM